MARLSSTALAAVVLALTAGCAQNDTRDASELVTDRSSLIAFSLNESYRIRRGVPRIIIESVDRKGKSAKWRAYSAPVPDMKDVAIDENMAVTHTVRFNGNLNAGGVLTVMRLPPGRYVLKEWLIPGQKGAIPAGGTIFYYDHPELRGSLDLPFVVRPNEVIYLGELLIEEGPRIIASDCRDRDEPLLRSVVAGMRRRAIRFAPVGSSPCVP